MTRIGAPELIIVLIIVVLLFGPGRIAKMAGELGQGIRSFKEGLDTSESKSDTAALLALNPDSVEEINPVEPK